MKRKLIMLSLLASMVIASIGCGFVKVVPIGQEANFTGSTTFDASAEAADSWDYVVEEITGNASPLTDTISGMEKGTVYAVTFSGKVNEYNTDTPKGYLDVAVDGVSEAVHVQVGKVYSGTSVRDAQTYKSYQDFTNQTEWSEYAKTLNSYVNDNVVANIQLEDTVGKAVEIVGTFEYDGGDTLVVTPVSITVE